jgi:hypothetical protein
METSFKPAESHIHGCLGNGALACTMLYPPFSIPEPPIPAIALPMINIFEDVAAPQMTDPSSKMPKKLRKVH